MYSLVGKRVLVVGGSSGIGFGIATVAANAGAKVTIAARSADKLARAAAGIGGGIESEVLDQTDDLSVTSFFARHGLWDHVVTSAGTGGRGRLPELEMAEAANVMNSKFWGYFRIARSAKIAPEGSLTFISGALGQKPTVGTALIAAVNSAIEVVCPLESGPP